MLGRTAGGLFWMFRYLERSENAARLIEAGFRIALTRSAAADQEWGSVLSALGARDAYDAANDGYDAHTVINFLLRDRTQSTSIISMMEAARANAREVRTALTREVFEATNEGYLTIKDLLARPVRARDLPMVLGAIRRQSALVRGALHGTMLRNDIYNFARLGTFLERADNTARILDVKYYVLLPSIAHIGKTLDNVQWEMILRSLSAMQAYRWLSNSQMSARGIGEFLLLDPRLPRSLVFSVDIMHENLRRIGMEYGEPSPAEALCAEILADLRGHSIDSIMAAGLHETIVEFIGRNNALAAEIERNYRFTA